MDCQVWGRVAGGVGRSQGGAAFPQRGPVRGFAVMTGGGGGGGRG